MNLMGRMRVSKLGPTHDEIDRLRATAPDGPIAVINLLKFMPGPGGKAAYLRYAQAAGGARHPDCEVIHTGPAFHDFGTGEDWDYIIIARYPRFEDFAWSVTQDAWQEDGARHRPEALERTLMIVSPSGDLFADLSA